MIKFRCPNCDQKLGVPDEYAGKRVRCSKCSQPCQVPAAAQVQTPQAPGAPARNTSAAISATHNPAQQAPTPRPRSAPAPQPAPVPAVQEELDDVPMEEETNPFAGLQFDNSPEDAKHDAIAAARAMRNREHARAIGSKSSRPAGESGFSASSLALGAGKIPLAVAISIVGMLAICIAWTWVYWLTAGMLFLVVLFPFPVAAAGASALVMFTQKRNFGLGVLAFLMAMGGIVTGKIMIARWVEMKQINRPFAEIPWEEQRNLIENPVLVYDIGTIQLWESGQFDATVAKSLILDNAAAQFAEALDEAAFDEESYSEEGDEGSETSADAEGEGEQDAADGEEIVSPEPEDDSSSSDSSNSVEEQPREYEVQHQAVCALIEPWEFADKQKAFEQYYDKYQQCMSDWLIATPIGFIVALFMSFSLWDLIVIPASLGMAFKIGMGSDA